MSTCICHQLTSFQGKTMDIMAQPSIGATIQTRQEIQCLLYARFFPQRSDIRQTFAVIDLIRIVYKKTF